MSDQLAKMLARLCNARKIQRSDEAEYVVDNLIGQIGQVEIGHGEGQDIKLIQGWAVGQDRKVSGQPERRPTRAGETPQTGTAGAMSRMRLPLSRS